MHHRTLTISRPGGIPIRLHWSLALVAAYLCVTLTHVYAGYASEGVALAIAAGVVLLLGLSIALHELAHALVARLCGVPVRSMTLFAFGGTSELAEEATGPHQELLVAIAGPLVSLALFGLSAALWWYGGWSLPGVVALHVGAANGLVALFHLLPGYPLDGGRVLRAVLRFLTGQELPATYLASRIGKICGWTLIVTGLVYALTSRDPLGGILGALIGYLLYRTAAVGYQQFLVRHALSGVRVGDVMQRVFRAVSPGLRLDHFVGRYVLGQVEQAYPVLYQPDEDAPQRLLGMIAARNLRRIGLEEWSRFHVHDAMTPAERVRSLTPDMPAGDAFRALIESGEEQLPVIDGETLLGIIRRSDMIRYIHMRAARLSAGR